MTDGDRAGPSGTRLFGGNESTADHVAHAVVSRRGTGRRPKRGRATTMIVYNLLVQREERGDRRWPRRPPDSERVNALDLPVFPNAGAEANGPTQDGKREEVTVPEGKKAEEARPFSLTGGSHQNR